MTAKIYYKVEEILSYGRFGEPQTSFSVHCYGLTELESKNLRENVLNIIKEREKS